jgi:hypothetical protein
MVFWDSLPEPGHLPRILSWHFLCTAHWQTAAANKVHRRPMWKSNGEKNKKKKNQENQKISYFLNLKMNYVLISNHRRHS